MSKVEGGYQPDPKNGNLNTGNPPQGGSGVPNTSDTDEKVSGATWDVKIISGGIDGQVNCDALASELKEYLDSHYSGIEMPTVEFRFSVDADGCMWGAYSIYSAKIKPTMW